MGFTCTQGLLCPERAPRPPHEQVYPGGNTFQANTFHVWSLHCVLCGLGSTLHKSSQVLPKGLPDGCPRPRVQVGKLRLLQVATPAVAGGLGWQKRHCHVLWGDEAGKG